MFRTKLTLAVSVILMNLGPIYSHVDKTSLSLQGGEEFIAGDTIEITWKPMIPHNVPHLIYYCPSPEEQWELIDSVPEQGNNTLSYQWIVPEDASESARIRIFQRFFGQATEETSDYTLVSKEFTVIVPKTPVISLSPHRKTVARRDPAISHIVDLRGRKVTVPRRGMKLHVVSNTEYQLKILSGISGLQ